MSDYNKWTPWWMGALLVIGMTMICAFASAGDLRINIPRRSLMTPVQKLNRDGVEAVKKHNYSKAKALFYKAYMFDPGDPFTLNNLGYISELEGRAEQANEFYAMAKAQSSNAVVDRSSADSLEGATLQEAVNAAGNVPMQINRANVEAIRLLKAGRPSEAEFQLKEALKMDPQNAFTLNNLGVVMEAEGDFQRAMSLYDQAGQSSGGTVIVTPISSWRGKPVAEMARANSKKLAARMTTLETDQAKVALFNLRGVAALNRNDYLNAERQFSEAFKLDPTNAFSLNNQGYLAEMSGDMESAEELYREARAADGADGRIGLATRAHAEGSRLFSVADDSKKNIESAIEKHSETQKLKQGPIQLKRRDGSLVNDTSPTPPANNTH